jgi:hypothetical protein
MPNGLFFDAPGLLGSDACRNSRQKAKRELLEKGGAVL